MTGDRSTGEEPERRALRARDVLGSDGPFARSSGGYELREAQIAMASAVESALADATILVCEAGTGTGKTLAYLVPALLSGQRVVISTATKALEEQILHKDIPLAARMLGISPRVALVKGLTNYVCLRRLAELRLSPGVSAGVRRSLPVVEAWARETETGDLSELARLGEDDPILFEIMSSSDTRIGSSCEHFERCLVTRMRREADQANVLIVNHHVFFADVALKASTEKDGRGATGVLGRFDAVVFDEAHRIEEIATDFFGVRISSSRVKAMLRDCERTFTLRGLADSLRPRDDGLSLVADVGRAADALFEQLREERSRGATREGGETRVALERGSFAGMLLERWLALDTALEVLAGFIETRAASEDLELLRRRAERLRTDVARVADPATTSVAWVELGARSTSFGASFVDVAPFLRTHVYRKLGGVVLTSATLSSTDTGGGADAAASFSFLRARLGIDELDVPVEELAVGSPFDHREKCLLYLPTDLPDVTSADFVARAGERIEALIRLTGGGAFVLTTSARAMTSFGALLRKAGVARVMVQGEAPKSHLLTAFRAHRNATLVATMSFWEGVDVPGDALRLVVIDRIPFSVPTEPVTVARCEALEARGLNPFLTYSVPSAAITLKQGFGRLIRTASDTGIVACLDRRLVTKSYGARILSTLPPAKRASTIDEVSTFVARVMKP